MSTTEVVNTDKPSRALTRRREEPTSIMEVLARAAANPRVDVNKLQALLEMQQKVELRQAEVEFNAALARLMPRLPRIEKNGVIPDNLGKIRSRFARYEDIDRVTRPLLADEGFSVSFRTEDIGHDKVRIIGTLAHRMGHARESSVTVPISAPPKATGTQAVGSSVSYGKRYVVCNMLNIITVGEDTDGQAEAKPITEEQILNIETMIQDTKADRRKFLAWMEVGKIEDITDGDYDKAIKALQAKARKQ